MRKTFISQDGEIIGAVNEDHADSARRHLAAIGVTPEDYEDLYVQMFRLGFARVGEDSRELHVEHKVPLSRAQRNYIEDALIAGKGVFVNDRRFTESKAVRGTDHTLAEQLLQGGTK